MLGVTDLARIGLTWGRCELIAPLAGSVSLTTECDVGCRHLHHGLFIDIRKTVNYLFVVEEINGTSLT